MPLGPKVAFHVGAIIRGALYIHGGISDIQSTKPSNLLYRLDLTSTMWTQIRTPGSPSLSHHAAVVSGDRYLILIGGWDGRRRTSNVNVYDTNDDCWRCMTHSGFPDGAGLSSHTANHLVNGDILVIGREGSLRIQRKHSDVYLLKGSVASGKFSYSPYSHEATSRSGHTADIVGNSVFIVGGRQDELFEKAEGFKSAALQSCPVVAAILETLQARQQRALSRLPCGRKNHVTICAESCLLVHGGETFDGRSREPVGEMFLISLKYPTQFFQLNTSLVKRAGHVSFVLPDRVLLHGGYSGTATVHSDLCQLKICI